jgi:restriction system protein
MPVPDYQSLMLPLLRLSAEGETRIPAVIDKIAKIFSLTDTDLAEMLPSGGTVLSNRLYWAKLYLMRANLLNSNKRGWFFITAEGQELLNKCPEKLRVKDLLSIQMFAEFYKKGRQTGTPLSDYSEPITEAVALITPQEQIENANAIIRSQLQSDLVERILQNTPTFFERIIVELLVKMGYGGSFENAARQLGKVGDSGVDGVINEDRLGLDRVYIQAKRYAPLNTIGRPDVQAFVGSLVGLGATKGVFVTTSSFSSQAVEFVRYLSQRVVLIDGSKLSDLMIEHDVGVRTYRRVDIKRIDEDFFSEEN